MNYRSIADMAQVIRYKLWQVPRGIDLVVGVPRSGMLAANLLALYLNVHVCSLSEFLADSPLKHGRTRKPSGGNLLKPSDASRVLVIDDSISTGITMGDIRAQIQDRHKNLDVIYAAVYATPKRPEHLDFFFETVELPRVFEWNVMHRRELAEWCLDIDGVLCVDPTATENDDGARYRKFLANALPLCIPTYPVGHLVTSRLEKYRADTESWLNKHGIRYNQLHMLDLPDAKTRRSLGCHGRFKADVYWKLEEAKLFVESEPIQAREIAERSGKPVLCFTTQELCMPESAVAAAVNQARGLRRRALRRLRRIVARP
jgi:uncharacterized HAD superfamily protein/hypoxanthine phosphoribosyltransferase